jgi:hypothetical protein
MTEEKTTAPGLREAIDAFRANEIGVILRAAGVADIPKTKDGKTALWLKLIGDPARIKKALTQITPRCRKALELLQVAGDEIRTIRYRTLLSRAGLLEKESKQHAPQATWHQPRFEDARDPVTFEEIVAVLLKYGLIWTHTLPGDALPTAKLGFEAGRFVYIPQEIAVHLPPPSQRELGEPEIQHILNGSARICQRDLYLIWSIGREMPLQLTNNQLLRSADLKRIAPQLLMPEKLATGKKEGDYRRIFFLRRLLTALGLFRAGQPPAGQTLEAVPDPSLLSLEPTDRVRASFQTWRDGAWWNELWTTAPTRAGQGTADFAPKEVVRARGKILDTLILLAKSGREWIGLEEISDYLHDHDYEFLIDRTTAEHQYTYSYYNRTPASPYAYNTLNWTWEKYLRDEEAGWEGVEAVFIRAVLTEGLYWLGLLDLGYLRPVTPAGGSAPDGLLAVRLTDMGHWLLLGDKVPEIPAESGRVILQPNFHIFAFDPISDSVLAKLDSFAVRLRAERAVEYEITRESVYRAQQAGHRAGDLIAWLTKITAAPVPQNVGRTMQEWQEAFEQLVIRPRVGWVQAASPEAIDALLALPGLQTVILKRVTPTSLLIRADKADDIELALLIAGELPGRASRPEDARRASITIASDGAIAFAHAVPSLYVYGYLHPFVDETAAGWRITGDSVARARAANLDALAIIRELETLALGGVPPLLQRRIKAWCKHFGDASLSRVTLLRFRDQPTTDELLADPELQPYLQPFHPEAKLGLVAVIAENIETVRTLLAERGVELQNVATGT